MIPMMTLMTSAAVKIRTGHVMDVLSMERNKWKAVVICHGCGHPYCGTYCCKHDEIAPHELKDINEEK
jgi:hypothetical protein